MLREPSPNHVHSISACLASLQVAAHALDSTPSLLFDSANSAVALIAQDDLPIWHLAVDQYRARRFCTPSRLATRLSVGIRAAVCTLLSQVPLLQVARIVCGVSPARCSPPPLLSSASPLLPSHRRLLATPRPAYSANEEGAKMTGSISAFSSRTCASVTVPRGRASGAGSRGIVSVADDYIILTSLGHEVSAHARADACTRR